MSAIGNLVRDSRDKHLEPVFDALEKMTSLMDNVASAKELSEGDEAMEENIIAYSIMQYKILQRQLAS